MHKCCYQCVIQKFILQTMENNMSDITVRRNEDEGDWEAFTANVLGDVIYGYGETEHQAVADLKAAIYLREEMS